MKFFPLVIITICLAAEMGYAQNNLPLPTNIKKTYTKGTRSTSGQPGKKYWQNAGVYDIDINFNPATRLVIGSETIVYTNNSPDTLGRIVFRLYPNLYKKGAQRLMSVEPADLIDGMKVEKITLDNETLGEERLRVDGTVMTIRNTQVLPGKSVKFTVTFSYQLNKGSHIRTGEVEDGAYFIAYFFPRIAVYDDTDGWNTNPYLGTQEFYNDFCNFKLAVTVPLNYMVWATGDLKNCSEVFTEKYCNRIKAAETGDAIINIIDSADLKAGNITAPNASNTWRYQADNVTDMAIGISNHYIWQSSSLVVDKKTGRRTRVDAVFNPIHKDYFWVVGDARKTVEGMSNYFPKWPYPYNHETVFDGLDQMEYPMMVNDNPVEDRTESVTLTDHEIFHTMFPFYMGVNETKYGWMDEGWATIGEWLISSYIDSTIADDYGMAAVNATAGSEVDMPITTLTTQQYGTSMFINSYPKPALGYLYAKDILGDDLYFKGLHYYISQWNGKHPLPLDFFNCMNTGSGKNLNWFWKRWFYDGGIPDLAITSVKGKQVTITSIGEKPVPVDITVLYKDGTEQKIHRSPAVWEKGNKTITVDFNEAKKVKRITLGSLYVADADAANNVYEVKN
jgi:Peptidase family M1 domain